MNFTDGDEDKGFWFMNNTGSRQGEFNWYLRNTSVANRMKINEDGVVTIAAGTVTSDEDLKENIQNLSGSLEKINGLTGKSFTWKAIDDDENVAPEDDDGTWRPNRYGPPGTQLGLIAPVSYTHLTLPTILLV